MILPRLGKWSSSAGRWFIWERLYLFGYRWTPLCRARFRYLKTLREANYNRKEEI